MIVSLLLTAAIVLFLALSAFCSGSETAFMSVNRGRILHLSREGSATAKIVDGALNAMNRTLTTILIGNNLANVVFSSAAAALGSRLFADSSTGHAGWTVVSAFAALYLGEFLPKLFCSMRPLRRSLRLAPFFRIFSAALAPLTCVAMAVTGLFVPKDEPKAKVTVNDLLRILQDRKDGVRLTDFESALISRILVLRRRGEFITVDALLRALDNE
ncbi:MAG: CNNM domain-containing protein [Kiritimatiellia bacterium]